MGRRQRLISTSILRAIFKTTPSPKSDKPPSLLARIIAIFSLFQLALTRYRAELFKHLREKIWHIQEEEYTESFRSPSHGKRTDLVSTGDLGYSGSTFFTSPNSKFMIKSLPRKFEQDFFRNRLLGPYVEHMELNPASLLVRITDCLYAPSWTLGAALGFAPSHHIVMENILYGKTDCSKANQDTWETFDLKPNDYFFPERDIAGGSLAPDSVLDRLIDEFPDKVRVTVDEKEELIGQIARDTKILQEANAVDYSILLIRYPASLGIDKVRSPPGKGSSWRSGIVSRDRRWVYRAVLLDFFWAKDSLQARAMTGLINSYNFVNWTKDHGPMSVTTTSYEYRTRFLRMMDELVEVPDSSGQASGQVINASGSPTAS